MENKNTYSILLDSTIISKNKLKLIRLKNYNNIRVYNSDKFSKIIADKIVFINASTGRINAKFNPHLAKELLDKNCDNWRIDEWQDCNSQEYYFTIDKRAEYKVNFDTGVVSRKLSTNERVCKHCHNIVDKTEIVGAFCENCLTSNDGLAYRYGYHCYRENYTIYEKKINQTKTALFGSEIERDFLYNDWDDEFDSKLKRVLIETVKIIYKDKLKNENVKRKAVFMTDGSLNMNGIEWITFPQSYKAYKQEAETIDEVLNVMKKYEFGNSIKAGNHIHINRKFFGDTPERNYKSKYAAAKIALLLNEYWDEFIAISKRQKTDYTEKPTQTKEDEMFALVEKTLINQHAHSVAVNLEHKDTIEIRIWSGIDTASDLLFYLDITQALAMFVKKKSLESCQKAKLIDIFKYLTDKQEHLIEIKKRLNDKGITKYNNDIENLLKSEEK